MYPIDWLEERSGLVGGIKYFLFRNVPSDINWMQTLGSAALTAFLVQAITGVILAMYYVPSAAIDPATGKPVAWESIVNITDHLTLGWLVRGMHRWGASVFIILMFLHMGRVFLFGAYKYPRELNWIIGVLILADGDDGGLHRLPPAVGPDRVLGDASSGSTSTGRRRSWARGWPSSYVAARRSAATTLTRFYSLHMLVIPGAIIGLITLHLYLVVRLGVTSPPWSKDAAGGEPDEEDGAAARPGLTRPVPRPAGAAMQAEPGGRD